MTGTRPFAILFAVLVCATVSPLRAHRLDEYLQAARIAIDTDRVGIELDLTPGVAIAPAVFAAIDRDRSGTIADEEASAYARSVVGALVMTLDGRSLAPRLDTYQMPAWPDVMEGVGVIRLSASAPLTPTTAGRHELFFRNIHRAEMGVYLANALVPADERVEITGQRRDELQHELTIDYRVRPSMGSWMTWPILSLLLVVAVAGFVALKGRR